MSVHWNLDDLESIGSRLEEGGRASGSPADRPGIQYPHAVQPFIPDPMGVAMKEKIRPLGRESIQLLLQVTMGRTDPSPADLQPHHGVVDDDSEQRRVASQPGVVDIPEHDPRRPADEPVDDSFGSEVAEMEEQLGPARLEHTERRLGPIRLSVGISDHADDGGGNRRPRGIGFGLGGRVHRSMVAWNTHPVERR